MLAPLISETPLMRPRDAVKLAYQRAFGVGHILPSEAEAAARLRDELKSTLPDSAVPPFTLIGRGLCRVNLASTATRGVTPETLARAMLVTEARFKPSPEAFDADIAELSRLAERGEAPFAKQELDGYLREYRAAGKPVVSHTEEYRAAYHPAYRVLLSDIGALLPVLAEVDKRLTEAGRALVAIDGDCGGGKTTLARLLCEIYGASALHMDDFFLPFEKRTGKRARVAGWCVDWERFLSEALPGLMSGGGFMYRRFDCATGGYIPKEHMPSRVTVIEGSYSHHPGFNMAYAELKPIKVFVSVEPREQERRLAARDPARLPRFIAEWIPLEKSYFKAYDIRRGADIAIESIPWEDDA